MEGLLDHLPFAWHGGNLLMNLCPAPHSLNTRGTHKSQESYTAVPDGDKLQSITQKMNRHLCR